jgi:hypothetical protein
MHEPFAIKQPLVSVIPFANVEVAPPVTFIAVVCTPAPNVEVAPPCMVVVPVVPLEKLATVVEEYVKVCFAEKKFAE